MSIEEIKELFRTNLNESIVSENLKSLRILCANEKSSDISSILDDALELCSTFTSKKLLVDLYELKIKQLYHSKENLPVVEKLTKKMLQEAQKIGYDEGIALALQISGYLEFLKGNRNKSETDINNAMKILNESDQPDHYAYIICNYSFSTTRWLFHRDCSITSNLEECVYYFYQNNIYRGFTQCLSLLVLIFQQTQEKEKTMGLINKIFMNRALIARMPEEIKSNIYYFIGVGSKLSFNLGEAEVYLLEAINILKFVYNENIYSGFYLRGLAHLASCYALQGKLELAYNQMKDVEELIHEGTASKNLDSFSKRQIEHDFNLTKFYIISRLHNVQIDDLKELIINIIEEINNHHSDAMFFSEFLLNANLSRKQLIKIKKLNNASTKRVEHIIDFLIEKRSNKKEEQIIELVSALKRRPVEERMTLEERAFADLLAAQEYFKLERYAEIYPLLRKYEKQFDRIEVLELRIFMEAFIQVGAYKNGDPLGPALQYMAIKKCQKYGFSRLENKLLEYLSLQRSEIFRIKV